MDIFYIDRQFGAPIFIDVENGIVVRCYNETEKYNAKMNENYKGKTINFLNEDFIGRAMKGTYHHLRPMSVSVSRQNIEAIKSRLRNIDLLLSSDRTPENQRKELEKSHKNYILEEYEATKELESERKRVLKEHNFNC